MRREQRTFKRRGADDPEALLNEAQRRRLRELKDAGWKLAFIRRPNSRDLVPVLFRGEQGQLAVLEDDGTVNSRPGIRVRQTDSPVLISCPSCGYMVYGRLWRCPGCGGTGIRRDA